jgi:GrpB-like predicted nucleotidyltransferase (UPF0157 family)
MASVVAYDPRWPARFEEEAELLRGSLGMADAWVEHIGSTAVPGLPARPVIDLLLVLEEELTIAQARSLGSLGYARIRVRLSGRLHLRKGAPRTHCLHLASPGSRELWETLAFRDLLRRNDRAAARYGALKLSLAAFAADGQGAYSRAKGAFIRDSLREASRGPRTEPPLWAARVC